MLRVAHDGRGESRSTQATKKPHGALAHPVTLKPVVRSDRSILSADAWKAIATALRISARELQIIQGIFDDRKELAIAHELTISVHTVHTHLERLYRKLGVSSRLGLVLYILAEYLSSLPSAF
jgi:DNA-binding NarL/FixJ family response regulator